MIVRDEKDDKDDKEGSTDDSDSKDDKDGDKDDMDDKDGRDDIDSNDDNDDKNDDDDDDEDFRDENEDLLSFEVDEIEEKDSDGNEVDDKHSVKSFDDVEFTFGHVDRQFMFQGIPAIKLNLSTYLSDPKANLEIIVYMFRAAGSVSFGNETFAVQSGTVKFNIKISNWDFCDDTPADCSKGKAGKYLDLSLKIKSKGSPEEIDDDDRVKADKEPICKDKDDDKDDDDKNDNDNDDNDDDDDDDCPVIYNLGGDSEMLLNRGVMIDDDEYTAMPEKFPKFERDDEEKKFVFRIPKFSRNVLVDPSVNIGKVLVEKVPGGNKNAASWLQLNVAVAVFLQVAAMFAVQ
ncbi:skeletal aspartic acid-rich protein 2-like isoform X2 [Oculina patagonica]